MNNKLTLNKQDQNLKKKLLFIIFFIVYPTCVLLSCVISPIYTIADSNVAYKVLPLIFYFINTVVELFVIYLSLATVIYGMYRLSIKVIRSVIILALCAPFFKNVLKLLVSPIVDGIPSLNNLIIDIYSLTFSSIYEVIQLAVVMLLAYVVIRKHKSKVAEASEDLVPFKKIIDLKNPLQCGALISILVIGFIKLTMWLMKDLNSLSGFTFDMIFFLPYFLDIVGMVIGYLFVLYVFISLAARDE